MSGTESMTKHPSETDAEFAARKAEAARVEKRQAAQRKAEAKPRKLEISSGGTKTVKPRGGAAAATDEEGSGDA